MVNFLFPVQNLLLCQLKFLNFRAVKGMKNNNIHCLYGNIRQKDGILQGNGLLHHLLETPIAPKMLGDDKEVRVTCIDFCGSYLVAELS